MPVALARACPGQLVEGASRLGQPAEEAGNSGMGLLRGQPVVCRMSSVNLPDGLRSADKTETLCNEWTGKYENKPICWSC